MVQPRYEYDITKHHIKPGRREGVIKQDNRHKT
jgi:hypothetical protein